MRGGVDFRQALNERGDPEDCQRVCLTRSTARIHFSKGAKELADELRVALR